MGTFWKASSLGFKNQRTVSSHILLSNWEFHSRGLEVSSTSTCYFQVSRRLCHKTLIFSKQFSKCKTSSWNSKLNFSSKFDYNTGAAHNLLGISGSKIKTLTSLLSPVRTSSCTGHINMSSTSRCFEGNCDKVNVETPSLTSKRELSRCVESEQEEKMMREAKEIFVHAVNSVLPHQMIRSRLDFNPSTSQLLVDGCEYKLENNVHVVGFGKAVLGMARALEDCIGDHIVKGVISVPVGAQDALRNEGKQSMLLQPSTKIQVMEGAANNLPDENAHLTASKIQDIVKDIGKDDILVVLISGGGSALLPAPEPPVTLNDMLSVTRLLSRAGASIMHLNTVRKQIDSLKGGGLAMIARPAKVISLILSDVIGDPLDFIASGPTVPDLTTPQECLKLFSELGITESTPPSVIQLLEEKCKKGLKHDESNPTQSSGHCSDVTSVEVQENKSVKYGELDWSHVQNVLVGSNIFACQAACEKSIHFGFYPLVLTTELEGEARKVGIGFAELAHYIATCLTSEDAVKKDEGMKDIEEKLMSVFGISQVKLNEVKMLVKKSKSESQGVCIIAGGETTVSVTGDGKGGRNQEMAVSTGLELQNQFAESDSGSDSKPASPSLPVKVVFLSAGTDGQDGPTTAAGGVVSLDFASLVQASGLNALEYLKRNDTFTLLSNFKDGSNLVVTGLTGTNVMDIHLLLVERISQ